ncbi:polyadenylate-binding protein-interacting protein 12-like [Wolffia australiana]
MNGRSAGSRNFDLSAEESPADSLSQLQPPPAQTLSQSPLQQQQKSVADHKTFLAGRSQPVHGASSSSVHQLIANGAMMASARFPVGRNGEVSDDGFKEMRDLEELLSKLNPMAEEFVPSSHHNQSSRSYDDDIVLAGQQRLIENDDIGGSRNEGRRRRSSFNHGKQRMNTRTSLAQRDDVIRKTVYVSDIDQQVTEEQLAALFINCGQVVDCRICGDPKSVLRFAFIEFTDEEGARTALSLSGTMLGYYPVRVLPSKTAIAPVNPTYLPRSEDELEMCTRTVYCTNIDKNVSQADVKLFFETVCGEVYRLRLLGDYHHSTRIAFVEFIRAESAIAALSCSGVVLGSSPIRVSPSKTPVRPRASRHSMR